MTLRNGRDGKKEKRNWYKIYILKIETGGYYLLAYARIIHLQVMYICVYITYSINVYFTVVFKKIVKKILDIATWNLWTYHNAFLRAGHKLKKEKLVSILDGRSTFRICANI